MIEIRGAYRRLETRRVRAARRNIEARIPVVKRNRKTQSRQQVALGDFIVPYHGTLPADICGRILEAFERDPNKQVSKTAGGIVAPGRRGEMVVMKGPEWAELRELVTAKSIDCLHDYASRFSSLEFILKREEAVVSAPVIEKIDPGQGFGWHIDSGPMGTARRFLSVLTYLKDIDDGGRTEFPIQNMALQPRQGTMVLFPPYWMYPHRGAPPVREVKYNVTNYFMVPERPHFEL
jgi:hypothetical protein